MSKTINTLRAELIKSGFLCLDSLFYISICAVILTLYFVFKYVTYTDYVGCKIEVCVVFKFGIVYIQLTEFLLNSFYL
jgi:hypothetical protein